MSNFTEQVTQIEEHMASGREKEIVPTLTLLIEIKEFEENNSMAYGFGQKDFLERISPSLYRILREYPLNGRNIDTRYELRKTAMTLLSLFFSTIMCQGQEAIKTYIQVCFHVILTDSEEIASYAYNSLQQYLTNYESKPPQSELTSLAEFHDEIQCYVQNFLTFLGNFSDSLYHLRSEEQNEAERVLATPLIDFITMKQKVPMLPTQNEVDEQKEAALAAAAAAATQANIQPGLAPGTQEAAAGGAANQAYNQPAMIPGLSEMNPTGQNANETQDQALTQQQSQQNILSFSQQLPGDDPLQQTGSLSLASQNSSISRQDKKFAVYGSRSLKYGGELLSALLCQTWESQFALQQPQAQPLEKRYPELHGRRLIDNFSPKYLGVFQEALLTRNSQFNWNQFNSGPLLKYLKCLTQIIHLMKNLIMTVQKENRHLNMSHFFEFIIALLRTIPQHENLLRFLVLSQFNDIMFGLIFGNNQEIRAEFQEDVKAKFLATADRFLSESNDMVLLTLKQVSNPVIQEQQLLVYRMYDLLQDKLNIEQICKIVSFLLHFTQHPLMTSANFKYRILTYVNTIIRVKFFQVSIHSPEMQGITDRIHDLQMQSLYCITKVVKYLHEQTDQAIEFFKNNPSGDIDLEYTVGESKKIKEAEALVLAQNQQAKGRMRAGSADVPMGGDLSSLASSETRKMKQEQLSYKLMELGVSRQELESKSRWEMVAMLTKIKQEEPAAEAVKQTIGSEECVKKKTLPIDSIFVLQEQDIVDAYNDSFAVSWRTISQIEEFRRTSTQQADQNQPLRTAARNLQIQKEWIIKTAKQAFFNFNFIQNWFYTNKMSFDLKGNKLYKRFMITACHLLQNLTEIMPNEEIALKHLSKLLKTIITSHMVKVMQFRDLLNAIGEDLFGLCVEAKVKGNQFGIDYLCRLLISFEHNVQTNRSNKEKLLSDQYTAHFLDAFFQYLKQKTEVFDIKNENVDEVPRCCLSKQDKRLAKLPFKNLQEAMQGLILAIGEQTLKHSNDTKVKHTFFSVFMFCMQNIRSGYIVPKYFQIIRALLKEVMQTDEKNEKKEVMRDFMPIVQGLLETFLQAKDEAPYVKEITSEICCLMPAKIRNLLEQLPAISIPLIDSMQSRQSNTSIHTIQYWHVILCQYPFLLDPILSKILPELNQSIQGTILPFMPHSMKLIGKLGAKSRLYEANNKFACRNFPEDGLKITLRDKNSQQTITFGIDSIIDVLFFQLSYKDSSYQMQVLMQAAKLVKSAFLCYVDAELDLDFVLATIVATRNGQQKPSADMFAKNGIRAPKFKFNARDKQIFVSQMGRGCESHAFVKLLRCAIMGYKALSSTPPEHKKLQKKQNNFLKWMTQYFTLIYIIKNQQLTNTMVDEINPLVFVDMIVELLYHYIDSNQLSSKAKDFPFYKGSAVALKTLIRFLRKLYGDTPEVFNHLEIVSILIKRICNQVQEPRKNLAINIAIRILIQELPNYAVVRHSETLMGRLFLILNQSSDSVVKSIEERVRPNMEQLFEALGMYKMCERVNEQSMCYHFQVIEMLKSPQAAETPAIQFFIETLDRILQNILCTQEVTQNVAMDLIEQIAARNDVKVYQLLRNLPVQKLLQGAPIAGRPKEQIKKVYWSQFIFEQEILSKMPTVYEQDSFNKMSSIFVPENLSKMPTIFEMYKSGYGQIQQLISYLNIVKFYLKVEEGSAIRDRKPEFLRIADCVILILEDECQKLDASYDPQPQNRNQQVNQSISITRIAKRYNKLERMYQAYNKEYDPYTHTLHPHQVFNTHFFEVSQQAKEDQQREEIEQMRQQQAYRVIFEQRQGKVVESQQRLVESIGDLKRMRDLISTRVDVFINTMFGPSQSTMSQSQLPQGQRSSQIYNHAKVHDVSNSYMRSLYEMYPNVRLHTEMICKCMDLICEISSHEVLSQDFAQCLDEFYNKDPPCDDPQYRNAAPETRIDLSKSSLKTPLDFYIVEIKAKIICIFFKFFQRDERNIQKMSKKCMKKFLFISSPQSIPAFPNRILRDCVRPILISISINRQQIQQFQHLGRIIKVLHNYFTEGLGLAILNNLTDLQKFIREPYKFQYLSNDPQSRKVLLSQYQKYYHQQRAQQMQQNQDPSAQVDGAQVNPPGVQPGEQGSFQVNITEDQIDKEIGNLIDQHNVKVQQISCAVGIINTLHLFYQQRPDSRCTNQEIEKMTNVVRGLLDFQKYLVEQFREQIEQIFEEVLMFLPPTNNIVKINEKRQIFYDKLNPLTVKVGHLQSDILQGLEKFYNKNVSQAQNILWLPDHSNRELTEMVLEILNRKQNYCIRQHLSLDVVLQDYDRRGARRGDFSQSFFNLISQVYSYSKFYPQCLKHQNNTDILDILREKWLNKDTPRNLQPQMAREIYMKIQKTLVTYCKNESADAQILFDLLKDFFCQIQLDLKPLVTLCTIDIPQKASITRQQNIMDTALTKIETSKTSYEAKYYMFEFAFMPLALTCANDQQKFDQLFKPELISKFVFTFFKKHRENEPSQNGGPPREQWIWQMIQTAMEKRQKISYQRFFTEIIKVLIIIMRQISSFQTFLDCVNQGRQRTDVLVHIIKFLAGVIKTATEQTLQSYAFFAITCFALRLLGLPVDSKGTQHDQSIAQDNPYNRLQQELFTLLRDSIMIPLLQLDLEQEHDPTFLTISKRLAELTTIEKQRQMMHHTEKLNQQFFKIHNRTLIENTYANLQRIFEDPRVQNQIRFQVQQSQQQQTTMRQDDQWSSFKRQFSLRPNIDARVALCQLIGKTSMLSNPSSTTPMDFNELNSIKQTYERVNRRIEKTVRQFFCTPHNSVALVRLSKSEKILSLIDTMYNWILQLDKQYKAQVQLCTDVRKQTAIHENTKYESEVKFRLPEYLQMIVLNLFLKQLYLLQPNDKLIQHIRAQAEDQSYDKKNEFVQFVQRCFSLSKEILQQLPTKTIMFEQNRIDEKTESEKLALKTTFFLNLLTISIKSEPQSTSNKRILTDFLQNSTVSHQEIYSYPNYYNPQTSTPFIEKSFKPMSVEEKAKQALQGNEVPIQMNIHDRLMPSPAHAFSEQIYQINMILHPIHVIVMSIRHRKSHSLSQNAQASMQQQAVPDQTAYLIPFLKQAMWCDVRRALDRDLSLIQKQLVQLFFQRSYRQMDEQGLPTNLNQNILGLFAQHTIIKNIQSSVNEEQKTVQRCLPHFTIRMINKLEALVEEGVLTREEFEQWVDPDLFKEISKIIQSIVSVFKLVVCSDKSMNKTIDKVISQPLSSSGYAMSQSGIAGSTNAPQSAKEDESSETYVDWEFQDDMTDFKLRQINQDVWMKESIMIALNSIVKRMKQSMNQEDILMTLSQLKIIIKSFSFESIKTCDYILDQLYEVVKYLVEDQQDQRVKLNSKEKLTLLSRLWQMAIQKPKELSQPKQDPNSITNRVCTLFLDFLELQPNILQNEQFMKHFDKLFMLNLMCSYEIRQRQFAIFEKFFGSSLKAKIVYFFNKLSLVNKPGQDNIELYKDSAHLKDLLEFTLFNFGEEVSLQNIKNSTNLCPLSCKQVRFEGQKNLRLEPDGARILESLQPFHRKYVKYVTTQSSLKHLMQPLTEIIRINPEHNIQDKNIAEKIFSKVFWQYWHILDRSDQQYLAETFNKVFLNFIRFTSMLTSMPLMKQQFARTLLEQVASLKEPQVRIEPEVLQYMGKHFNLWHVSIPLLEDHVQLFDSNERYVHALQELYSGLMEEDYSVGLSRIVTKSPEMRSMYTFSQHHNWEQINSLFGQYINFYAEQEGLLKYLEHAQEMPGKYSRQLAKTILIDMINDQSPASRQTANQCAQQRQSAHQAQSESYDRVFEKNPDIAQKLANRQFPRPGGNRNISDIDLRSWENLYMTSLKILKKSELFKDVADNMNRFEQLIEHYWQKKDCKRLLLNLSRVLQKNTQQNQNPTFTVSNSSIQRVRYYTYYSYVLSEQLVDQHRNPQLRNELDENYQQNQQLAVKQITENLPSYIDTVQNEYFILFQQILESQEGISNMLLEQERKNYNDLRNMMNIWRERLPHKCETIQTWQDVLENRRFIFHLLHSKMSRQKLAQKQSQQAVTGPDGSVQISASGASADIPRQNSVRGVNGGPEIDASNPQAQQARPNSLTQDEKKKLLEQVDLVWINLKLAEISRKHGMPNLAEYYQQQNLNCFNSFGHQFNAEDNFKLEYFKYTYERFKLKMTYCQEEVTQHEILKLTAQESVNPDFAPWQQAELHRIIGEHYLSKGKIYEANESLLLSIDKNKKEAKTWLAYAKLNDTIFQQQKDEKSALNCLKGYFSAMTLSQHKARLIIPNVFKLLKQKSIIDAAQFKAAQQQSTQQQAVPMPGQPQTTTAPGTLPVPTDQPASVQQIATGQKPAPNAPPGQPTPNQPPGAGVPYVAHVPNQKINFFVTKGVARDMPKWLWIFWLPQVLQFLSLPNNKDDTLQKMCLFIGSGMCVSYPQVTWYPLKAITEYHRDAQGHPNKRFDQMCKTLMEKMNKKLLYSIMHVMKELYLISRTTKDEQLISTLKRILNFSDHLQQKTTTERLWKNYIRQIYEIGLVKEQPEAEAEWERLIQNDETNEKQQLEQIKIVKNIKDYLLIQSNMRDQDIYLQEESPYLATFPQRGIELPGQYVLSEVEPRPENAIIIERMGTTITRSGHKDKKINFRCTNGKNAYFTMTTFNSKEFRGQLQLERVTQLKVVSNMILKRHKESARRGIKFYAAPQILSHFKAQASRPQPARPQTSQFNRLVQDDKTFGDLQEIHDYLLQERGLDPDIALLMQVQHVQDIQNSKPENEREFSRITEAQIQHLNKACYSQMRKEVQPHLLSSYFHRIFSNVDNMFIFKKQFTKYHAINSFFTYVFNFADKQDLGSLSFCKASGRINVQQANLRHALVHLYKEIIQATSDGSQLNFQEIEQEIFRIPVKPIEGQAQGVQLDPQALQRQQKVEFYVPFRITPNIEQFIGKIGIQGLFAGVLTSASLAMSSQNDKTHSLIELLLSEEYREFKMSHENAQKQEAQCEAEAKKHADFCMYKIKSLSEHKKIIEQPPKSEESKAGPPTEMAPGVEFDPRTQSYSLGTEKKTKVPKEFLDLEMDRPDIPEEYNKKVFTLIEMATDDTRRCQKSLIWCPWF